MNILQVLPILAVGGAERMAVNLAINLQLQGHKVEFISLYEPTGIVGRDFHQSLLDANITTHNLGKKPGFDVRMMMRLWKLIDHIKPDIIHTHLYASIYTMLFPNLRSFPPLIHTVHNTALKEGYAFDRFLRKTIFRRRVQMVAIGDEVKHTMCKVYNQPNFPVIPNGIAVESYVNPPTSRQDWRQANGFQASDVIFVCVAKMMPQKRHDNLIDAFARAKTDRHVKLLLVGDGPLRPQIATQIETLGLSGRVHLLGQRTDIACALGASDVFVLASDWEGNPLAVMEAMAVGLPAIATNVGGVAELVVDGASGIVLSAGDVTALAQAINQMLADSDRWPTMGCVGQHIARQEFSDQTMARRYFELYQNFVSTISTGA